VLTTEVNGRYTEAHHNVYGTVTGAEPMMAGSRLFEPARITVRYTWATQVGDTGWRLGYINVAGRWLGEDPPTGSGSVILWGVMPDWAKAFADENKPTIRLVTPVQ
jgi:hypothetical protein